MKLFLTLITVAQLSLLVVYYRHQLKYIHRSWYIPDSASWLKHWYVYLLVEASVIAIHSPPTGYGSWGNGRMYDNTLATFVAFRLYTGVRLIRDYCPLYIQRGGILAAVSMARSGFNWIFGIRYFFLHYMWYGVMSGFFVTLLLFGYGVTVLERTVNPKWTFEIGLWNTAVTMLTVGYGDFSPTWAGSRSSQGIAALIGILLSSLFVFIIVQKLEYTHTEKRAYARYKLHGISIRQRKTAATYIQLVWRRRMFLKRIAAALAKDQGGASQTSSSVNDASGSAGKVTLAKSALEKEKSANYARFVVKSRELKRKLKHYRRQQSIVIGELRKEDIFTVDLHELDDGSSQPGNDREAAQSPSINPAELVSRGARGRRNGLFGSIAQLRVPSFAAPAASETEARMRGVETQMEQVSRALSSLQQNQQVILRQLSETMKSLK